jgi:hypothetical protein
MTLEVERKDGSRYEVSDRWTVAVDEPISVGSVLRVLIDRQHPRRVVIDWDATRAIHRELTRERRRQRASGVPAPVGAPATATPVGATATATLRRRPKIAVPLAASAPLEEPTAAAPLPSPAALEGTMAAAPPSSSAAPEEATGDLLERLERVSALHSAGSLTDDEFEVLKRRLLA